MIRINYSKLERAIRRDKKRYRRNRMIIENRGIFILVKEINKKSKRKLRIADE